MKKIYVYALALTLVAACKGGDKENEDEAAVANQEEVVAEVDTMVLHKQTFQKQLLCNGRLAAIQKAELQCPNQGTLLQSVCVKNGQYVSAGTLLAVADTHDKTADLDKAKHDMERAKMELQDKLIGLGYGGDMNEVPADVRKKAEITSGYYSAKFQLASAEKALKDCRLVAPFSGRIADLSARAYQQGGKFCTLIDDSSFDVEFKVLEAELSFVKAGQNVRVSPFVDENVEYAGTVTEINPTIDDKGLVAVKARISNKSGKLIDGMNVRVIVENAVPQMFVVPKEAVVERDGYHVVFMYDKDTHRSVWTYVDILYSNLKSFAITGCAKKETEIHEGDIVITSGNMNLADDTEVRANEN
ncbi:MAG: efflux RND transporter periplasmic adaptor subunit [Bacteroidaceae bacterium]|jgi:RND family efflux transporter MFP subunit|nr:efflux RND transporter periplasmic adaptor subunit [Bacteroidaceae bacterium]